MVSNNRRPLGVRVVVALACEAAPIVARYRMRRMATESPLSIYGDADHLHYLVVSGIGYHAATMATAYLAGVSGACKSTAWLNVGIAGGSPGYPLGSLWLANKIVDTHRPNRFYPALLPDHGASTTVVTVDQVEDKPGSGTLVDMEAAGFYRTASGLATHETVQCLKVVSDHGMDATSKISKAKVQSLIEAQMTGIGITIDSLLDQSNTLATRWADPPYFAALSSEQHYTVSQAQQLRLLLQRWHILLPHEDVLSFLNGQTTVLTGLTKHLDAVSLQPTKSR